MPELGVGRLRESFRISSITCEAPSGGQWGWESSAPQRKPRYRALDRGLLWCRSPRWFDVDSLGRLQCTRRGSFAAAPASTHPKSLSQYVSPPISSGCMSSSTSKVVVQRRTGPVGCVNMQSHGKGDMPIQCRKQLSLWLCGVYVIYGPESYSLRASSNLVLRDDCAHDVRMATLSTTSTCMTSHAGWLLDRLNVTCLTLSLCTRKNCSCPFMYPPEVGETTRRGGHLE